MTVLPQWIPILLDTRFLNIKGQYVPRYEDTWNYRHRVFLDERSGLWRVRDETWQPHGIKFRPWRCRNGDSSHVEDQEMKEVWNRKPQGSSDTALLKD